MIIEIKVLLYYLGVKMDILRKQREKETDTSYKNHLSILIGNLNRMYKICRFLLSYLKGEKDGTWKYLNEEIEDGKNYKKN